MRDLGSPQRAAPLHGQLRGRVAVLVGGYGGEKVARVSQAVGADRAALGQGQSAAVVLAEVAPRRTAAQFDAELHATRDHCDLAGPNVDDAELGPEAEHTLLRDEKQLTV